MAVLTGGILGGINNKVGNVVGFKWKDKAVIRAYAIPSNPQTILQTTQRNKFTTVQKFVASLLTDVAQKFWKQFATSMSEYNAMISANLNSLTANDDYAAFISTKGNLETANITSAGRTVNVVNVDWDISISGNGLSTDFALLVVYDFVNHFGFVSDGVVTRNAGEAVVNVFTGTNSNNLICLLSFYRLQPDGSYYISDSKTVSIPFP